MATLEDYISSNIDMATETALTIDYYSYFLRATDYIPLKIIEGVATKEDYASELEYRQFARAEISRLKG